MLTSFLYISQCWDCSRLGKDVLCSSHGCGCCVRMCHSGPFGRAYQVEGSNPYIDWVFVSVEPHHMQNHLGGEPIDEVTAIKLCLLGDA